MNEELAGWYKKEKEWDYIIGFAHKEYAHTNALLFLYHTRYILTIALPVTFCNVSSRFQLVCFLFLVGLRWHADNFVHPKNGSNDSGMADFDDDELFATGNDVCFSLAAGTELAPSLPPSSSTVVASTTCLRLRVNQPFSAMLWLLCFYRGKEELGDLE